MIIYNLKQLLIHILRGRENYLLCLCFTLFFSLGSKAQVSCISSGNWSSPIIWSPAPPTAGQTVIVAAGCTLTVDVVTPQISDLTINGVVQINSNLISDLQIAGNILVNANGQLVNKGIIHFNVANKTFTLAGNGSYFHNPIRNILADESIFYNSLENFSPTSTLILKKWYNGSIALGDPSRVATSNFGNIVFDASVPGGIWDQDGYFSLPTSARIKGNLTVSSGTVIMDDGTGNTTSLVLQDVIINNSGKIIFQRGANRNLNLTTGSCSVANQANGNASVVMDTSVGILTWNVNGNLTFSNDFYGINGNNYILGGDFRLAVTGNIDYTGGKVFLVNRADAPCKIIVSGNTTLNNTTGSGSFCFLEGGNGACNFTTNDFNILNGLNNYLLGQPSSGLQAKGTGTFTINNDINVSGTSSLYFAYADSSINKIRIAITRDFNCIGNSNINGAYTSGTFTLKTGRNISFLGGKFSGQIYYSNASIDSIIVGTAFTFNSSVSTDFFKASKAGGTTIVSSPNFNILNSGLLYGQGVALVDSGSSNLTLITSAFNQSGGQFTGILSGSGNFTFNCSGALTKSAGVFKGCSNTVYSNPGIFNFTLGSIDFSGGYFSAYHNTNNSGGTGIMTVNGNCSINFTSATDEFYIIGLTGTGFDINNLLLNLSITGSLNISGANGTFISSRSLGSESISLGSMQVSGGTNSFNCEVNSLTSNGHNISLFVSGNINIDGGTTYLSAYSQTLFATINGGITITNGSLSLKGGDCTTSTVNVLGGFSLTNGEFYLHNTLTDELPPSATITLNINSNDDNVGNFIHTGGIFTFDNCLTTPAALNLIMNVKSPTYTLGGTGVITMTKPGISTVYAYLNFARNGTTNFDRSGSHLIQQVKQTINSGCILDIVNGDMQIASNNSISTPPEFLWVNSGGVLNVRSNKIFSNALKPNSGITVLGRIKTANTFGLYNGTTNATFSTNISDNLDYYLASTSTIEYNGTSNQIVTGIGIGKAQFSYHKYGNLDINFQGIPNINFAFLTNLPNDSSVAIRTALILTNGELNLDDDHNPSNGGGRKLIIESGLTSSIQRSSGYIRSETEDNSALLKWNIGSNLGAHVIPFGFSSTEYIPFTFTLNSGSAPGFYVGSYHTGASNLPLPPSVTHIRNNSGVDNNANTVDRFWSMKVTGSSIYNASLNFKATPTEIGTITSLTAQRWILQVTSWTNPPPGTQTPNASGNSTSGITDISNWWTLSGNNTPLPIDLIRFEGACKENEISLDWTTASETNNDYFLLESSTNGFEFSTIASIKGHGTASSFNNYSFVDKESMSQINYYRLTQFDFDGNFKVYPVIAVHSCRSEIIQINSTNDGLAPKIILNSLEYLNARIVIYTIEGKEIRSDEFVLEKGENNIQTRLVGLSSGIYLLKIDIFGKSISKRFFIN